MIPEMVPVAFGTTLLGLGSASSVAADRVPRRARPFAGASVILFAGAAAVFALLIEKRWADLGFQALHSHFESCVIALAGLSLGAVILARGGSAGFRAAVGAGVVGAGLALLALGDDPEPNLSTAVVQTPAALVFYTLKSFSFGVLLAASGGAAARILAPGTAEGNPEAWDRTLLRVVRIGLPGLLAAFLVGVAWHESAGWRSPFGGEASETWTLAVLLTLLGWLHLRQVAPLASRVPSFVLLFAGVLMAGWWTFLDWMPGFFDSLEYNY